MTPGTKHCGGCRTVKPSTAFGRNASRHDGLNGHCRDCVRVRELVRKRKRRQEAEALAVRIVRRSATRFEVVDAGRGLGSGNTLLAAKILAGKHGITPERWVPRMGVTGGAGVWTAR